MFKKLLFTMFKHPIKAIEMANTKEAFKAGVFFFLIVAGVHALLAAVFNQGGMYIFYYGIGASLFFDADTEWGTWIFIITFVLVIATGALCLGILLLLNKLFKGQGTFKSIAGAMGTASVMILIVLVVLALVSGAMSYTESYIIMMGVWPIFFSSMIGTVLFLAKVISIALKLPLENMIYIVPIATAAFLLMIGIINTIFFGAGDDWGVGAYQDSDFDSNNENFIEESELLD